MNRYIKYLSAMIASFSCFVIAAIGVVNNVNPATCSYRAVCGAIFVYCFMVIILRITARIIISSLLENIDDQDNETNQL